MMTVSRERTAWLKDRTRALIQGTIEGTEVIWQDWAENMTDEEAKVCFDEMRRLSAMINKMRTFVSVDSK